MVGFEPRLAISFAEFLSLDWPARRDIDQLAAFDLDASFTIANPQPRRLRRGPGADSLKS